MTLTIDFEVRIDPQTGIWSLTSDVTVPVSIPATVVDCSCLELDHCAGCGGYGLLLVPDRERGDENLIEVYYRQHELDRFRETMRRLVEGEDA